MKNVSGQRVLYLVFNPANAALQLNWFRFSPIAGQINQP
jgi:hypothetical protein